MWSPFVMLLVLAGLTTALAPAWYFIALERTMVTNVTPGLPFQARLTVSSDF